MKDQAPTTSEPEGADGVTIRCKYVGGHSALGKHGHHFRIKHGQLGHGEFSLTHSIPLSDVVSVVIAQRGVDNQDRAADYRLAVGGVYGSGRGLSIAPKEPRVTTDITVQTRDGQEGHWVVEQRDGGWVHNKLSAALLQAGIRLD